MCTNTETVLGGLTRKENDLVDQKKSTGGKRGDVCWYSS